MTRRLLPILAATLLLTGLAFSQQPVSLALQPGIVQSHSFSSSGSVTSAANVFSTNNLQGDSIVVVFANGNNNNAAAPISDTNSNTYFKAAQIANGASFEAEIWYATNIASGANTVTVTPGGSNASIATEIYEVAGLLALSPQVFDQTNSGTATGTSLSTGAATPLLPNEFGFAAFAVGTASQIITVGAPYKNDSGQLNPGTPAGLFSFVSASSYLASMASTTATATITSEPWAAAIATFRAVAVPVLGTVSVTGTPSVSQSGPWNVRTQDGSGNALTSNSSTYTAKFGLDMNLLGTLGTAFSTAGKVDVKGADGDVFVRQATATNLKVAIAGNAGGPIDAATAAPVPSNAVYAGGNSSGNLTGIIACDHSAPISMSTATTTQIIAISGTGGSTYICSIDLVAAGADNVTLISGSGTNCASNVAAIIGGTTAATGWNFAANGGLTKGTGLGMIYKTTTTNNEVCVVTSAAVQLSGSITYTQF